MNPRNYLMKNLKKDGHHVSCLNLHSKSCKQSLCIYVCVCLHIVYLISSRRMEAHSLRPCIECPNCFFGSLCSMNPKQKWDHIVMAM
jgi:hypothetical protein